MKKIDKLILSSFLGPFFLTFVVVVFILLNVQMLKYYDDFMGKGLSNGLLAQLFLYFGIVVSPTAFPLAVLLSSLMTFGNLGEHFELTAIKSAGISLVRALVPIFIFVLGLTAVAFYSNNNLVPKAALEAYSLLYDIKQKKPALDLREGVFYQGIPDFSIKVNKKYADGQTIGDVIIYDHRDVSGNKKVTLADSGKMYTILNERYLKLELYDGHTYIEGNATSGRTVNNSAEPLTRSSFSYSQFVLDLSSFALNRTDKNLFQTNRIMRNLNELVEDVDSLNVDIMDEQVDLYRLNKTAFFYHMKNDTIRMPFELASHKFYRDSVRSARMTLQQTADSVLTIPSDSLQAADSRGIKQDSLKVNSDSTSMRSDSLRGPLVSTTRLGQSPTAVERRIERIRNQRIDRSRARLKLDSIPTESELKEYLMDDSLVLTTVQSALTLARQAKQRVLSHESRIDRLEKEKIIFEIQWHKILSNSFACIMMFLIGAPLGSIIKRGGLGIPVLVSIVFFIIFYVLSIIGEKWAKAELISPMAGIWAANFILLPIGLIFLRQARLDARLFDSDFYNVQIERFKTWWQKKFTRKPAQIKG
ncbi:LptF/LptG family permease [Fulvivirga sedimenti]|uniref:LptF/LptG family permease n=1 Tax=Fulvivirga sedimenti TaxID=2879465 RepID=A0A9X1KU94_9BACT|nr:LptF/LptG family permease [Fulvivirga sedimenti]MCA6073233.1 LptF/LptG family permease [Fulvivirga sedimenti]